MSERGQPKPEGEPSVAPPPRSPRFGRQQPGELLGRNALLGATTSMTTPPASAGLTLRPTGRGAPLRGRATASAIAPNTR